MFCITFHKYFTQYNFFQHTYILQLIINKDTTCVIQIIGFYFSDIRYRSFIFCEGEEWQHNNSFKLKLNTKLSNHSESLLNLHEIFVSEEK